MPLTKEQEKDTLLDYREGGNISGISTLYTDYIDLVYGLCLKYLKNTADAEDAVMSIYELILGKLKTQEVNHFRSWLYIVAKNHCLEHLRSAKRELTKQKEFKIMHSESFFHPDDIQSEDLIITLQQCLSQLSKEQKEMIELFYYQRMSYQEIVDDYRLSWNTVRSRIQNGRRNLKSCIEKLK